MAYHVDIVKNEPTSTASKALARVVLYDSHIDFGPEADYWRELLQRIVQIDPDERPQEFLAALQHRIDGTYVYATEPHEDGDDCPVPGELGHSHMHAAGA